MLQAQRTRPEVGVANDGRGNLPGEGGTPAHLGGMGERCKLPHQGLGQSPKSRHFFVGKTQKAAQKSGPHQLSTPKWACLTMWECLIRPVLGGGH